MSHMKKRLLTICLCICLLAGLISLTGCGTNGQKQVQTETAVEQTNAGIIADLDLVTQIIRSVPPDSVYPDTMLLLNELKQHGFSEAMTWKQILEYWEVVNEPEFVGLPYTSDTPRILENADTPETGLQEIGAETPKAELQPESGLPLPDDLPQDDTLVIEVLGFALQKDGSMREELIHRLETALACAQQYPNAYVLVTGGGTASQAPEATEADAMAAWLLEHGLDESRLIIENRSKTTCENAVFSYEILRQDYPQVHTMAIVTSDYHIPLGCLLFQAWFLLNTKASAPDISVAAHASCLAGSYTFTLEEQAYWLENLTTYR